jgi:hypothetical protein
LGAEGEKTVNLEGKFNRHERLLRAELSRLMHMHNRARCSFSSVFGCIINLNFYSQIIGTPKVCYASERSVVDPNQRQMTLKTTNVTFGSFLSMDEVLQYRPHPTDPSKTLLRQQATVSIEGVPLNRYMEDVLTKNISFNASRGRQGLEWVINKINTEVSRQSLVSLHRLKLSSLSGEGNRIISRRSSGTNQEIPRWHHRHSPEVNRRSLDDDPEDSLLVRPMCIEVRQGK